MAQTIKDTIYGLFRVKSSKKVEIGIGDFDDQSSTWIDFVKREGNKEYTVTLLFNKKEDKVIDFEVHESIIEEVVSETKKLA